ncbi:hypothetical protein DU490_04025 [Halomonas sp. DQ26W]|nr:hypothetical protein DU490_04025 [Halomonas sp. DQ26W]
MRRTRNDEDSRRGQLSQTAKRHAMFDILAFGAQECMGHEGGMVGMTARSPMRVADEGGSRYRVMYMAGSAMVCLGRKSDMRRRSIGEEQQCQAQEYQ